MTRILLSLLGATILLSSCASYSPTTVEGAKCKLKCAKNMQNCEGSSYTCDRSYALCIDSCKDIDRLSD